MKLSLFYLALVLMSNSQEPLVKPTKLFLIRHAETTGKGKDPELSKKGLKRANKWANILKSEEIDIVYTTEYKRTQATGSAIATQKNVSVEHCPPFVKDLDAFLGNLAGKSAVIVGHSNTIPKLVNDIIGKERFKQLDHEEYGTLFIISWSDARSEATVTQLVLE